MSPFNGIKPNNAWFKQQRLEQGLSQLEVANQIGVGRNMINRFDNGYDMRMDYVLQYALALGFTPIITLGKIA